MVIAWFTCSQWPARGANLCGPSDSNSELTRKERLSMPVNGAQRAALSWQILTVETYAWLST